MEIVPEKNFSGANNNPMTFKMSQGNSSFGLLFLCATINSGMVIAIQMTKPHIVPRLPTIEELSSSAEMEFKHIQRIISIFKYPLEEIIICWSY